MAAVTTAAGLKAWMRENRRPFASSVEIAGWIGCEPSQVATRLRQPRDAGEMVCVTKGGWTPADNGKAWATDYIDAMMSHLGCRYYIGELSAASMFGCHSHGIKRFTVLTDKRLQARTIAGTVIKFVYRPVIAWFPARWVYPATWNYGAVGCRLSTLETTLLDLTSAGASHMTANVAGLMLFQREMPPGTYALDPQLLAETAELYPVPVRQRVGYVLAAMSEQTEVPFDLRPLRATVPDDSRDVGLFAGFPEVASDGAPVGHSHNSVHSYDPVWKVHVCGSLDSDL